MIFFFFSLFLGLYHPIFAWKEDMMVFSKFLNFFASFFGIFYSRSGRNPSKWFFFICSLSRPFPSYFCLKRSSDGFFFKFLNIFLYFYIIFYYRSGRNPSERFFFIFSISQPFPTYFSLKRSYDGVF